MAQRILLKQGVPPTQAVSIFRAAAQACRALGHTDPAWAFTQYRAWVEDAERQLASLTSDPETVTMLLTQRRFLIQEIGPNPQRLWGPLYAERDLQAAALDAFADDLQARIDRAGGEGQPAVLDTNILLHYQRPDYVTWPTVLGRTPARLVVPLRVVEELDEKKYAQKDTLSSRARAILPWLEDVVVTQGGKIRDDTTIEVPIDPTRRPGGANADGDILNECHELRDFGGQGVTLVTGDTSMRLRARAAGIPTATMPDSYLT